MAVKKIKRRINTTIYYNLWIKPLWWKNIETERTVRFSNSHYGRYAKQYLEQLDHMLKSLESETILDKR